ncbi:unnamed protein product, partial [Laminaria digitata]
MMMPGSSQAAVSAGTPSRWYRFHIDCSAHPTGVSVKSLIREADGPRRKFKSAGVVASAATSQDAPTPAASAAAANGAGAGVLPAISTNPEAATPSSSAAAAAAALVSGETASGVISAAVGLGPTGGG